MKTQCKKKVIPLKTKFNSERFDDSMLLEAMAVCTSYFTFYSRMGSGVQSPVFKIWLLISCMTLGNLQNHCKI